MVECTIRQMQAKKRWMKRRMQGYAFFSSYCHIFGVTKKDKTKNEQY